MTIGTKERLTPLKLLDLVYPVIPSGGGTTGKAPLVRWEAYQTSFPTPEDIENWENTYHPSLWGIVTGRMSTIVVVDIDKPELKAIFDAEGLDPHIKTPRGGYHYWFRYPNTPVKTMAGVLPGIDIRADGGFVNVIGKRADGEYQTLIIPTPETIYSWDRLPSPIKQALNNNHVKAPVTQDKGNWVTQAMQGVPEGQRDAVCTRLAGYYLGHNLHPDIVKSTLYPFADKCSPPLPHADVDKCVDSITKRNDATLPIGDKDSFILSSSPAVQLQNVRKPLEKTLENKGLEDSSDEKTLENVRLAPRVRDWVNDTSGWFTTEELDRELGILTPLDKNNRRFILYTLKSENVIEQHQKQNKLFRRIDKQIRLIDFKSAGNRKPLELRLPLEIEKYTNIYPGNIIVIAGASNAGKTAWLLNFIRMNQDAYDIHYYNSEMGESELANRLSKFEGIALEDWKFKAYERSTNFEDVISPDAINLIDYLEVAKDFFEVGEHIRAIHDNLDSGICIIAIQKNPNSDLGRGGNFSIEKARLYLSMDANKATIIKAKNWVNPEFNPNRMVVNYKIVAGCKFIVTENWHKPNS